MFIWAKMAFPHTLLCRVFWNCWWPSEAGFWASLCPSPLKILPLELNRKVFSLSQFRCRGTKFFSFDAFSRSLHSGYSRTFRHALPHNPSLCPPAPHAGARARRLVPFQGYFSTWHLPVAEESNKIPLFCVFSVNKLPNSRQKHFAAEAEDILYPFYQYTTPVIMCAHRKERFPCREWLRPGQSRDLRREEKSEEWLQKVSSLLPEWQLLTVRLQGGIVIFWLWSPPFRNLWSGIWRDCTCWKSWL